MQLNSLKKQWNERTRTKKLEIIESSHVRRLESFEKKSKKKSSGRKKKVKRKKKTPKTAEGLARLLKDMSPDERENFKLMIQLEKEKRNG